MSQMSDFFACSFIIEIEEPAFWFVILLLLAVSQVELPRFLIPTALSDSHYLITSLPELRVSPEDEGVLFHDLSDRTLPLIFDSWWGSMSVSAKHSVPWNNSSHASSWGFDLHCGNQMCSSAGIICFVFDRVLRHSSEHGPSSMWNFLLSKTHNAKINELAESEVTELTGSTVNGTALEIVKRQGIRGIPIVSWQRKFITHIPLNVY